MNAQHSKVFPFLRGSHLQIARELRDYIIRQLVWGESLVAFVKRREVVMGRKVHIRTFSMIAAYRYVQVAGGQRVQRTGVLQRHVGVSVRQGR